MPKVSTHKSEGSYIPQVTVYIRKEDLEQWKAIIKKSEFLSKALKDLREKRTLTVSHTPKITSITSSTSSSYTFNPKKDKPK